MAFAYPPTLCLTAADGPVSSRVLLPGSKSITNRALLAAALADGDSLLRAPLHSDDTRLMVDALRTLGVAIEETPTGDFHVTGCGGALQAPAQSPLLLGNSGTSMRFLTAAACLIPSGSDVVLDGNARMRERPLKDLLSALLSLGVSCESVNGGGCPPVRVRGGGLPSGSCRLRGDVSSQFLSALLLVAPFARQSVTVDIVGELVSKPYIDITQAVMRDFGVTMENAHYQTLHVPAGQRYAGHEYVIEADASGASYFLAAAAATGGSVTLANLGTDSIQGDIAFGNILEQMGCTVTRGAQVSVTGPARLSPIDANLSAVPDTAQTLAVLCLFADGPSRLTGLASLRVKETDRVRAIATELPKLGARVEEGPDFWVIHPPAPSQLRGATIATYDDHRMAMAFAVASLRVPGVVIEDPACVAKTFPDFWKRWQSAFGQRAIYE